MKHKPNLDWAKLKQRYLPACLSVSSVLTVSSPLISEAKRKREKKKEHFEGGRSTVQHSTAQHNTLRYHHHPSSERSSSLKGSKSFNIHTVSIDEIVIVALVEKRELVVACVERSSSGSGISSG